MLNILLLVLWIAELLEAKLELRLVVYLQTRKIAINAN
jgi:hypothetical protein